MRQPRYADGFSVTLHHDLLDAPRRWWSPRLVFVNSMSDLFHEEVPLPFVRQVFQTMVECPQHVFEPPRLSQGTEPPHIHVQRERCLAKFWLQQVALAWVTGFRAVELRKVERLVVSHQQEFLEAWHEYFGS